MSGSLFWVTFFGESKKVTAPRGMSALVAHEPPTLLYPRPWFDKLSTNGFFALCDVHDLDSRLRGNDDGRASEPI